MQRRFFAMAIAALSLGSSLAALAQTAPATPKYRVVMHVSNSDPRGWNQALNNVLLMTRNLEGKVEIRLVANGAGLGMLKAGAPTAERVAAALARGATLLACGETMKALQLEKEDMLPAIGYVERGLQEIMDRQLEGWLYLKAD